MCLNCQITQFDQNRADAFADRLVGALNEGALCVILSIGHRTRLFDSMQGQVPMTSSELAQYIPMMGTVEDELVGCFEHGGGVPYERFDRFHDHRGSP